jgi:ABC-type sugar transport system substrate-binding protein
LRLRIVAAVILFAMALGTEAQQARKTPLIGLLDYSASDAARVKWWNAFRQALQKLGYVEGQSVPFEAPFRQLRGSTPSGVRATA